MKLIQVKFLLWFRVFYVFYLLKKKKVCGLKMCNWNKDLFVISVKNEIDKIYCFDAVASVVFVYYK